MSKSANFHSLSRHESSQTLNKTLETDNVCGANLSDLESSALAVCAGCGRRFVPTGPQRYCSHDCYSETLRTPIEQRFWTKVNKFGPAPAHRPELGRCWMWTAATIRGYGQISLNRKPAYAHRVSYEWAFGSTRGLAVLHKCDEPLCVRPDHLFLGTQQDNLQDARNKGRLNEKLPRTRKLSYTDRLAIFEAPGYRGVCVALARQYGVTKMCIAHIRKGRFARRPESNVERVPTPAFVELPIRGEVHAGDSLTSAIARQGNQLPAERHV